ncbi:MAG: DUF6089 family protein, partial [Bacteroidota bacterium]
MRQHYILLCGLLWSAIVFAQPKGELSVLLGGSAYTGEFTAADSRPEFSEYQFAPGLRYIIPLSYTWQVRAGLQYAQYEGNDAISNDAARLRRDFSFDGSLFEGSAQLVWEPFAKRRYPSNGGYKNIISPYLFGGVGLGFFSRTTRYGIPGVDGFPNDIQQDIDADESPTLTLPFGGGVRVDVSKSLSIGLEMGVRKTFTDQLDGVSNSGKPDTDDWFAVGGVTISYRWSVPDFDRDGFLDDVDACPERAGVDYAGGCPDSDGDGLADDVDTCPYQAGKVSSQGCPDKDYDTVPDFIDECPNYPGSASAKGCLDTDGDGLKDDDDMCPNCAAFNGLSGCPDSDGDGVEDARDRCPNLPGLLEGWGCPYLDADLDGVADEEDECPNDAGLKSLAGCPDTDGDGIKDADDKCPEISGSEEDGGCPAVSEDIKETLAFVAKAVQFEIGSDQLKDSSREKLEELLNIMQEYPYYNLQISGHTDSRGNDANNLRLSKARAEACFDYLKSKGIDEERM